MGGFQRDKKKEYGAKMVANCPFSSRGVWEPLSEDQGNLIAALSFHFLKPKHHFSFLPKHFMVASLKLIP